MAGFARTREPSNEDDSVLLHEGPYRMKCAYFLWRTPYHGRPMSSPCGITFRYHSALENWLPSPGVLDRIATALQVCAVVEFIPRSQVEATWRSTHGDQPFPGLYAYRAYARGGHVRIFVDATETPDSLLWLLLHELAHVAVDNNEFLDTAFRTIPRPANYTTDDRAHEAWPEEKVANQVADQWAPRLGGRAGLDRLWWRKRVEGRA